MDKKTDKTALRKQFEKVKKLASNHNKEISKLCEMEEEIYGISHDAIGVGPVDPIADAISYGTSNMSFETYDLIMLDSKKPDGLST